MHFLLVTMTYEE